jgi:hypothetical protein
MLDFIRGYAAIRTDYLGGQPKLPGSFKANVAASVYRQRRNFTDRIARQVLTLSRTAMTREFIEDVEAATVNPDAYLTTNQVLAADGISLSYSGFVIRARRDRARPRGCGPDWLHTLAESIRPRQFGNSKCADAQTARPKTSASERSGPKMPTVNGPGDQVERKVCLRCSDCGKNLCARGQDALPAILELLRIAAAHDDEHLSGIRIWGQGKPDSQA